MMLGLGKKRVDHIRFDRIPLDIFIGDDPEERANTQRIVVSMDLSVSPGIMKRAARTDDLRDAVDFKPLIDTVREVAGNRRRILLETLAEDIATAALSGFPIKGIGVAVEKPNRYQTLGGIGVEIERFQPTALERVRERLSHLKIPGKRAQSKPAHEELAISR